MTEAVIGKIDDQFGIDASKVSSLVEMGLSENHMLIS